MEEHPSQNQSAAAPFAARAVTFLILYDMTRLK